MNILVAYETYLRLGIFFGLLLLLTIMEALWPQHQRHESRAKRWTANLGLSLTNSASLVALPVLASGAALWAQQVHIGIFHVYPLPQWLEFCLTLLLLDLAIFLQHMAFHYVPWLWRIHKVHHSDLDLDATSGVRFHPVEIIISMLYKITIVIALGADPIIVILFEILLNGFSLFTHSNLFLPVRCDKVLQWVLVTPHMHRIHHSPHQHKTNSNFGFTLSLWDRLFHQYHRTDYDSAQKPKITLGLAEYREAPRLGILQLLFMPFRTTSR